MKEIYSELAEQHVLGALMANHSHAKSAQKVQVHEMFTDGHRKILAAVRILEEQGIEPNYLTVWQEMQRQGTDRAIKGMAYLVELHDMVPMRYDPVQDSKEVQEKARLRDVYTLADSAKQRAEEGDAAEDILYDLSAGVVRNQSSSSQLRAMSAAEMVVPTLELVKHQREFGGRLMGITTGIDLLDRYTTGWRKGELTYVGALPGRGKTSFLLQSMYAAAKAGHGVGCISLEMQATSLIRRLAIMESGMHAHKFRDVRTMNDSEWHAAKNSFYALGELPISICDQSGLRPSQIASLARQMVASGAEAIFVDFVQIIHEDGKERREAINRVSAVLRDTCKALDIPFIVASQLARRDSDPNRRPTIQDLRESGNLEQDAHNVLLLYRPKDKSTGDWSGEDEIIVDKAREGMTGIVPVKYDDRSLTYTGREAA